MECWAAREAVAEFPVIDLGFQGVFSAGLDTVLNWPYKLSLQSVDE
jgi:hypothetical protein